ncbi:MAG: ABC-2 type transport system ATP-binding protein [Flavobacteriaceae bacterium]|jgi:ABC-2 type transport system ATP-binding protein|tara:strand:+ start:6562 stop:7482 length:921 start_codon:yes stop_codon:yes gene_type:complete
MPNTLLELNALTKKYGSITAVNSLSLKLEKGKVYGLLGPNGSGKSTTLGMVLNVINPTSGEFKWYEGNLTTHEALRKIGAIIERPNFYPYMTAQQNLRLICKIKQCSTDTIEKQLRLVGLFDRRKSKFSAFSLGMKQRLAIAAALLNNPELLILDEPTNGLDPEGINQIRKLIKTIAALGTTVLLASHLLDEVEKVCTDVIVLKDGIKYYEGPVDEISQANEYFEIASESEKALLGFLENHPAIGEIHKEKNFLKASMTGEINTKTFFKEIQKTGLSITHFSKKKPSLEEQFLSLTQTKEDATPRN